MKFKKGDRVVCVSKIPKEKVVEAFGDYAYRWYDENLELNKIYTIMDINPTDNSWEEVRIFNNYWIGDNNFKLLKDIRKQKIEKINETR